MLLWGAGATKPPPRVTRSRRRRGRPASLVSAVAGSPGSWARQGGSGEEERYDRDLERSFDDRLEETVAAMRQGGAGQVDDFRHRCLVLDVAYRPINVIGWERALCMDLMGKADVLEIHDDVEVHSAHASFLLPAVIRIRDYHENYASRVLPPTRRNVLLRDGYECQYCGTNKGLITLDHVVPLVRGGGDTWTNLVAACAKCNNRKGHKRPQDAGMKLKREPRAPAYTGFVVPKSMQLHPPWAPYTSYP